MFSHMKRKLILGALLAGACYMPCMAGSMDEVTALTEDPVVVYSFKPGDAPDVITNGLEEMGGWEKVKEKSFSWDEEVEVTYTRKLDDEILLSKSQCNRIHLGNVSRQFPEKGKETVQRSVETSGADAFSETEV